MSDLQAVREKYPASPTNKKTVSDLIPPTQRSNSEFTIFFNSLLEINGEAFNTFFSALSKATQERANNWDLLTDLQENVRKSVFHVCHSPQMAYLGMSSRTTSFQMKSIHQNRKKTIIYCLPSGWPASLQSCSIQILQILASTSSIWTKMNVS